MSRVVALAAVLALVGICCGPSPARGTLIDFGTFTRATTTGLDWLDLTPSDGLTADFVSTQFGSGGLFDGYQFATLAEVDLLLAEFSLPATGGPNVALNPGVTNFHTLFGITIMDPNTTRSGGFTSTAGGGVGTIVTKAVDLNIGAGLIQELDVNTSSNPGANFGSFLVKQIPEPSCAVLLVLAFGSITWQRRR